MQWWLGNKTAISLNVLCPPCFFFSQLFIAEQNVFALEYLLGHSGSTVPTVSPSTSAAAPNWSVGEVVRSRRGLDSGKPCFAMTKTFLCYHRFQHKSKTQLHTSSHGKTQLCPFQQGLEDLHPRVLKVFTRKCRFVIISGRKEHLKMSVKCCSFHLSAMRRALQKQYYVPLEGGNHRRCNTEWASDTANWASSSYRWSPALVVPAIIGFSYKETAPVITFRVPQNQWSHGYMHRLAGVVMSCTEWELQAPCDQELLRVCCGWMFLR